MALKLPSNSAAERTVLGLALVNNELFDEIATKSDELFSTVNLKEWFHAMKSLRAAGSSIDPVTLMAEVERLGLEHAKIGSVAYLGKLTFGLPHATSLTSYLRILEDCAARRRIIKAARQLAISVTQFEDPEGSLASFQSTVETLARDGQAGRQSVLRFGDALGDQVQSWDDMLHGRIRSVPTGIVGIDSQLTGGGFTKGMFHVACGVPGGGKSSLLIDATGNAVVNNLSALYFTAELSRTVWIDRFLSPFADVPRWRISSNRILNRDVDMLTASAAALADVPLWIDDRSTTIPEIKAKCAAVAKQCGGEIDLIVVDYLQLMSGIGDTEHRKIKSVVDALCWIAKEYNAAVIALSQFKRRQADQKFERPVLDWLKESGSIGEAARTVLAIWQTEDQYKAYEALKEAKKQGRDVQLIKEVTTSVIKQGEGGEFDETAFFDTRTMTFGVRRPLSVQDGLTDTVSRAEPEKTSGGPASRQIDVIWEGESGDLIFRDQSMVKKSIHDGREVVIGVVTGAGQLAIRVKEALEPFLIDAPIVDDPRFESFAVTDNWGKYELPSEVVKGCPLVAGDGTGGAYAVPLEVLRQHDTNRVATSNDEFSF